MQVCVTEVIAREEIDYLTEALDEAFAEVLEDEFLDVLGELGEEVDL
jgi:hypothetical protein